MLGRRSLRAFSYGMVAVFAFGLGSATPAFAESGGLPALTTQVQTLVTGLAAEIARAIGAETKLASQVTTLSASNANLTAGLVTLGASTANLTAGLADEAKARKLYQDANDQRLAAHDHALAAQALWQKAQEAINARHEENAAADHLRQAAHELADDAKALLQAEALRASAAAERAHADEIFANAVKDIELDIVKQDIVKEHERAAAAEDALRAQALLAAAKAAEADAATLEKAVSGAKAYTDLQLTAVFGCRTAEGLPGHIAAVVGKDNTVTWQCVLNGQ